jgi:chemotaxis protein MotB
MAEETVEELEKKEGEPVAEGEADSNEDKEKEKKEEKEEEEEQPPEKKDPEPECKCEECPKCVQLVPAWMPTFADMATLLMAFFVMILSFAEMNVPKFKQISGTMKNSFGVQRLIPTVEQPKATSVIAQNFSPAVAQPTVLDTVKQDTTDETKKDVELKTEDKTQEDGSTGEQTKSSDPETEAEAKKVAEALKEEIAQGKVKVSTEGEKVVVELQESIEAKNAPEGGGGSGEAGQQRSGVVSQESIELFAKIAEVQASVSRPLEARQASTGPEGSSSSVNQKEIDARLAQIKADLSQEISDGKAEVFRDGDNIVIRLAEQGSFVSGKADLQPGFLPLLEKVGKTVASGEGNVKIEGHTDNVPVIENPRFKSNWDLSGARAGSVADYFIQKGGVPPGRINVSGHADTKPVGPNDTATNRAKNRRIEVIVSG